MDFFGLPKLPVAAVRFPPGCGPSSRPSSPRLAPLVERGRLLKNVKLVSDNECGSWIFVARIHS